MTCYVILNVPRETKAKNFKMCVVTCYYTHTQKNEQRRAQKEARKMNKDEHIQNLEKKIKMLQAQKDTWIKKYWAVANQRKEWETKYWEGQK